MTGVRFVALALRIVALWFVLLAIQSFGVVLAVQRQHPDVSSPLWGLIPATIFLGAAAVLWIFPVSLARGLYPSESTTETMNVSGETAFRVGCCLLGLWQLTYVIPALARIIILAVESVRPGFIGSTEPYELQAIFPLIQLAVGATLLFKNKGLYQTLFKE